MVQPSVTFRLPALDKRVMDTRIAAVKVRAAVSAMRNGMGYSELLRRERAHSKARDEYNLANPFIAEALLRQAERHDAAQAKSQPEPELSRRDSSAGATPRSAASPASGLDGAAASGTEQNWMYQESAEVDSLLQENWLHLSEARESELDEVDCLLQDLVARQRHTPHSRRRRLPRRPRLQLVDARQRTSTNSDSSATASSVPVAKRRQRPRAAVATL